MVVVECVWNIPRGGAERVARYCSSSQDISIIDIISSMIQGHASFLQDRDLGKSYYGTAFSIALELWILFCSLHGQVHG